MIKNPGFGIFSHDDQGPAENLRRSRKLHGEPEHVISASQRAAAAKKRKSEAKEKAAREAMASVKVSHCSLCGAVCPPNFNPQAYDDRSERRKWVQWLARNFYKCASCATAGRKRDVQTKYCIRCGTQFERVAGQSEQSWAAQGRCPSCRQ